MDMLNLAKKSVQIKSFQPWEKDTPVFLVNIKISKFL